MPVLVVVLHLDLKRHLVDGPVVVRAEGEREAQMCKCAKYGKAGTCHFGMGRETGFAVACNGAENHKTWSCRARAVLQR